MRAGSFALLLCAAISCAFCAAPEKVIKLGIVPFNSPAALVKTHRPLRDFLAQRLGCDVAIFTSVDHTQFLRDIVNGEFDILLTTGHFIPFSKGIYTPVAAYKSNMEIAIVVGKNSSINKISDLNDKLIGLPDRLSLYYIAALHWLKKNLPEGRYQISEFPLHMAGIIAVSNRQLDAVFTAKQVFMQSSEEIKGKTRVLDIPAYILPPIIYATSDNLDAETIKKVREALFEFEKTDEGKEFFLKTGYIGFRKITQKDIDSMNTYTQEVEELSGIKIEDI
ncbi:MAG: phosphate/phosphite/phosphonate ABC transporter substrate-binding protein [Helicobacteraceae bacterium]|jgi:phosphonate transport system substrate-binding protein|nr:phosphate/phosphite/phosphonate ABC transporter substrate-binding protein [Helicobacteraceae bacterium]